MKKILTISFISLFLFSACNDTTKQETSPSRKTETDQHTEIIKKEEPKIIKVKVALIALNDNGKLGRKIGCNDSVVLVEKNMPLNNVNINGAFTQLFSLNKTEIKDPNYQENLYNAIYKMQENKPEDQKLKFKNATIENGTAKIYLTGNMGGLGGVCDSPRVPAQIEETAKQFSGITSVETYLNDKKVDWESFGRES